MERTKLVRTLVGLLLGLCVVTIGLDPIGGTDRYVFTMYLIDGVPFVSALIGLFAISEVWPQGEPQKWS